MAFDSKNFNSKIVKELVELSQYVKNNENQVFLGFYYLITQIMENASRGYSTYTETFFEIKKGDFKILKVLRKEFQTLGYKFEIVLDRRSSRYTIKISWN